MPNAPGIGSHDHVATVVVRLGDVAIRVATLDEVIASKRALDRPKDRAAMPALEAAREAQRRGRGE